MHCLFPNRQNIEIDSTQLQRIGIWRADVEIEIEIGIEQVRSCLISGFLLDS